MLGRPRWQASSYTELASYLGPAIDTAPCRSRLAGESGGSVDIDVGCWAAFAGKPAPTRNWRRAWGLLSTQPPVGAGLPAKAVGQATSMLNVSPPSRASPHTGCGVMP